LRWPLSAAPTDRMLGGDAVYRPRQPAGREAAPGWGYVHDELRRPGVMLMLLWEEYQQREPGGYRYSR